MTCGWPWISFSLEAGLSFPELEWLTSLYAPWSHLLCRLRRSEHPPRAVSALAYCDLIFFLQNNKELRMNENSLKMQLSCFTIGFSVWPFKELPACLTSSSGPRPCPRPKPWHSAAFPVTATEAGSQHCFHILMLCSVLRVTETLWLLILLAATRGTVVNAGTISSTLRRRDGMKESKNLADWDSRWFLSCSVTEKITPVKSEDLAVHYQVMHSVVKISEKESCRHG